MATSAASVCTHLDQIRNVEPQMTGCAGCMALGQSWVQLRMCMSCGHAGCCDSSKGRHASAHFHQTRHPLVRSFRSGDDWAWCYVDEVYLRPAPRARAA